MTLIEKLAAKIVKDTTANAASAGLTLGAVGAGARAYRLDGEINSGGGYHYRKTTMSKRNKALALAALLGLGAVGAQKLKD